MSERDMATNEGNKEVILQTTLIDRRYNSYEKEKAALRKERLSPSEYEARIREISNRYGI